MALAPAPISRTCTGTPRTSTVNQSTPVLARTNFSSSGSGISAASAR